MNMASNKSLEDMIRQCLKLKHKQDVNQVRCHVPLGIGVIHVDGEADKHQLVKVIGKIIIDLAHNITVSFVDELELISYVVIGTKDSKDLPVAKDLCRR